ncbi:helicase associated domain-containing protein [Streptomyces sp. NPDC050095]|uniref:helicase associated domain-containing protein n=1 Tax=unclassified Streptomyces TaxID=2593676 RepID=UPI00343E4786
MTDKRRRTQGAAAGRSRQGDGGHPQRREVPRLRADAGQFPAHERHLDVPRRHVEELPVAVAGPAAIGRKITPENTVLASLGRWVSNTRRQADKLSAERRTALDALGIRW